MDHKIKFVKIFFHWNKVGSGIRYGYIRYKLEIKLQAESGIRYKI